jgi:hypothetical protein
LHTHLRKCPLVPDGVKDRVLMEAQSKKNKENIPPPSPPTTNSAPISAPTNIIEAGPPTRKMRLTSKLTSNAQREFESDMCQMFASCGWAWNSSNNPQLRQFFSKWVPDANVPDRRKLSGPVLDAEVKKVEDRVKERVHGQLATGQSDGWKNISKASVVGTMITVDGHVRTENLLSIDVVTHTTFSQAYLIHTHNISADRKDADSLLALVEADIDHCETVLGVTVIGWTADAGGDSRGMRVRLHRKRTWIVQLDCWAHQVQLNLHKKEMSSSFSLLDSAGGR